MMKLFQDAHWLVLHVDQEGIYIYIYVSFSFLPLYCQWVSWILWRIWSI